jgi:hypothetical protein
MAELLLSANAGKLDQMPRENPRIAAMSLRESQAQALNSMTRLSSSHPSDSAAALRKVRPSRQQFVNATRSQQRGVTLQDPRMNSGAFHVDVILKQALGRLKIIEAPIESLLGNIAKIV